MPLLRIAQIVFALFFLAAVGSFLHFLGAWKATSDQPLAQWQIPSSLEEELDAGRHHLWLIQKPQQAGREKNFQQFWQEGWQLRGNYLDALGNPTAKRLLITPSSAQEAWPNAAKQENLGGEELILVGFFTLDEASRIRLQANSVRENSQAGEGQILLAKSSIDRQHRLSIFMLLSLVGGILAAVLSFFFITSFLPRSFLEGKTQASQSSANIS